MSDNAAERPWREGMCPHYGWTFPCGQPCRCDCGSCLFAKAKIREAK